MMSELAPGRREAVEKEAARLIVESRTLRELRRVLGLTQEQVAEAMETSQARVAQIEKTTDVKVSTVAKVVEALGGTLQLIAVLPGREAVTLKFGEDGIKSRQARPTSVPAIRQRGGSRVLSLEPAETAKVVKSSRRVRQFIGSRVTREMAAAVAEQKVPRVAARRTSPGAPKGSEERPKPPKPHA